MTGLFYGMNEKTDPIATIAFHPQVTDTTSLIPKGPLNDIARLLDSIVGTPKADQARSIQAVVFMPMWNICGWIWFIDMVYGHRL